VSFLDGKSLVPLIGKSGEFSLFLANGKQSEYLNEKIRFLQELQIEYEKTLDFTQKLNNLELFEPMNASINLNNGDNLSISGFYTINQEKFKCLEGDAYKELVATDDMKLIYEHFSSMDNFSKLVNVIAERKVISKKRTVKNKPSEKICSSTHYKPNDKSKVSA